MTVDLKQNVIDINLKRKVEAANNQQSKYEFGLNHILRDASQQNVFDTCVKDIADSALDGISGCVLAYGQTGAGKTYTMSGPGTSYAERGVMPRSLSYIFAVAEKARQDSGRDQYIVRISYVEIYNDRIIDLLSKSQDLSALGAAADGAGADATGQKGKNAGGAGPGSAASASGRVDITMPISAVGAATAAATGHLQIQEDRKGRVFVPGMVCPIVRSEAEALNWLFAGEANRALAEHALNKASTRSHCIFSVYLEQQMSVEDATGVGAAGVTSKGKRKSAIEKDSKRGLKGIGTVSRPELEKASDSNGDGPNPEAAAVDEARMVTVHSKLHLVDLAGSERLDKTASEGAIRKEAQAINKSLAFLEQVVVALLDKDREHVPYRQSKLTHLLKDALGGHCRTRMIATIWPEADHIDESISTLRFATRMMRVKTTPIRDVSGGGGMSDAERDRLVALYEAEIAALRTELALHDALIQFSMPAISSNCTGAGASSSSALSRAGIRYGPISPQEADSIRDICQRFCDGEVEDIEVSTVRQMKLALHIMRDMVVSAASSTKGQQQWQAGRGRSPIRLRKGPASPGTTNIAASDADAADGGEHHGGFMPGRSSSSFQTPAGNGRAGDNVADNCIAVGDGGTQDAASDGGGGGGANSGSGASTSQPPAARNAGVAADRARYADEAAKEVELQQWRNSGAGAGLYSDYATAKQSLKEKKVAMQTATTQVNDAKKQIDSLMLLLQQAKARAAARAAAAGDDGAAAQRDLTSALNDADGEGDDGEEDDEGLVTHLADPGGQSEAEIASQLSTAKSTYRTRFEAVQELKQECDYLQKVSASLAHKVATEFASHWAKLCGMPERQLRAATTGETATARPEIGQHAHALASPSASIHQLPFSTSAPTIGLGALSPPPAQSPHTDAVLGSAAGQLAYERMAARAAAVQSSISTAAGAMTKRPPAPQTSAQQLLGSPATGQFRARGRFT